MKNILSKLLAVILVLLLAATVAVPAFAVEEIHEDSSYCSCEMCEEDSARLIKIGVIGCWVICPICMLICTLGLIFGSIRKQKIALLAEQSESRSEKSNI